MLRASIKIETLEGSRGMIQTIVIAPDIEQLKRKVLGIVELIEDADIDHAATSR